MEVYVPLKTRAEVATQRRACCAVASILAALEPRLVPGVTTAEVDEICAGLVRSLGLVSSLMGFKDYPATTCVSVNHVAAHGVPGHYALEDGDIVTIDLTVMKDGWHGDAAWTYFVGTPDMESRRLMKAAWHSTMSGIRMATSGNRLGDIGNAIENAARRFGCSVIDSFVGHGIGKAMHEDPKVLNSGEAHSGPPVVPGMVFTVEPIVCLGSPEVHILEDGWTVVTNDSSRCAQFEHTVAVFSDHTDVLTDCGEPRHLSLDFPPFF